MGNLHHCTQFFGEFTNKTGLWGGSPGSRRPPGNSHSSRSSSRSTTRPASTRTPLIDTGNFIVTSRTLVNGTEIGSGVLPVIGAAMLSSSKGDLILGFGHPRSASSTAVSSRSPQNANRIRLSGSRLANATPAEIAAMPPSASGNPTSQSTLPASA
jgi:hypothetical protein